MSAPKPKKKPETPSALATTSDDERRITTPREIARNLRMLERYVQNNIERHDGADNLIRDRLDKIESLLGDMLDADEPLLELLRKNGASRESPFTQPIGTPANRQYLSGRWIRQDGNVYARGGNGGEHDKGSVKVASHRGRALRKGGRGAPQGV